MCVKVRESKQGRRGGGGDHRVVSPDDMRGVGGQNGETKNQGKAHFGRNQPTTPHTRTLHTTTTGQGRPSPQPPRFSSTTQTHCRLSLDEHPPLSTRHHHAARRLAIGPLAPGQRLAECHGIVLEAQTHVRLNDAHILCILSSIPLCSPSPLPVPTPAQRRQMGSHQPRAPPGLCGGGGTERRSHAFSRRVHGVPRAFHMARTRGKGPHQAPSAAAPRHRQSWHYYSSSRSSSSSSNSNRDKQNTNESASSVKLHGPPSPSRKRGRIRLLPRQRLPPQAHPPPGPPCLSHRSHRPRQPPSNHPRSR